MTWLEAGASVCLLAGATLSLIAALGLLRLPDVSARLQAATKPQVLGLLLVLLGVAPFVGGATDVAELVLVGIFQLATAPVLAQVVGRGAYRAGAVPPENLVVDHLARDRAGDEPGRDGTRGPPSPD